MRPEGAHDNEITSEATISIDADFLPNFRIPVVAGRNFSRDIPTDETEAFIEWASHYEDGGREGRTLEKHLAWLAKLPCPVLRLDGSRPLPDLVAEVCRAVEPRD